MKQKNTTSVLSEMVKNKILKRWKTSKFNSIPQLAKYYKIKESQVNKVVNDHILKIKKSLK